MNLNLILPQLPFLLTILAIFVAYGVMVKREVLTGAQIWQGGIVMGLIAIGIAALNDRLNLKLLPGMSPTIYLMNPAAMAFCAAYCVVISYRVQRVVDVKTWNLGDTKVILRICPVSKLPDADALILPTATNLAMKYGIPSLVKNSGGETILKELAEHKQVGIGKIVSTGPGKLAVGSIYHVACWEPSKATKADILRRFVGQALVRARDAGAESVCILVGGYSGIGIETGSAAITEAAVKQHRAFGEIVLAIVESRDAREVTAGVAKILEAEAKTDNKTEAKDV